MALCFIGVSASHAETNHNNYHVFQREFDEQFLTLLSSVTITSHKLAEHLPEFYVFEFAADSEHRNLTELREHVLQFRDEQLQKLPGLPEWLDQQQAILRAATNTSETPVPEGMQTMLNGLQPGFWPSTVSLRRYKQIFSPYATEPERLAFDRQFVQIVGNVHTYTDKPKQIHQVWSDVDALLKEHDQYQQQHWVGSDATLHQYQLLVLLLINHMQVDQEKLHHIFAAIGKSYQEGGKKLHSIGGYGSSLKEEFQDTFGEEYTLDAAKLYKEDLEAYTDHNETIGRIWQELTSDRRIGGMYIDGKEPGHTILKVTAYKDPEVGPYTVSYSVERLSYADAVFFPEKFTSPVTINFEDGQKTYEVQTEASSGWVPRWMLGPALQLMLNKSNKRKDRDVVLLMTPYQWKQFREQRGIAEEQFEEVFPLMMAAGPTSVAGSFFAISESVRKGVFIGAAASPLVMQATAFKNEVLHGVSTEFSFSHLIQVLTFAAEMGIGFGLMEYAKILRWLKGEGLVATASRAGLGFGASGFSFAMAHDTPPIDAASLAAERAAFAALFVGGLSSLGRYHALNNSSVGTQLTNYAVYSVGATTTMSGIRYQIHGELYDALGYPIASLPLAFLDGAVSGVALAPLVAGLAVRSPLKPHTIDTPPKNIKALDMPVEPPPNGVKPLASHLTTPRVLSNNQNTGAPLADIHSLPSAAGNTAAPAHARVQPPQQPTTSHPREVTVMRGHGATGTNGPVPEPRPVVSSKQQSGSLIQFPVSSPKAPTTLPLRPQVSSLQPLLHPLQEHHERIKQNFQNELANFATWLLHGCPSPGGSSGGFGYRTEVTSGNNHFQTLANIRDALLATLDPSFEPLTGDETDLVGRVVAGVTSFTTEFLGTMVFGYVAEVIGQQVGTDGRVESITIRSPIEGQDSEAVISLDGNNLLLQSGDPESVNRGMVRYRPFDSASEANGMVLSYVAPDSSTAHHEYVQNIQSLMEMLSTTEDQPLQPETLVDRSEVVELVGQYVVGYHAFDIGNRTIFYFGEVVDVDTVVYDSTGASYHYLWLRTAHNHVRVPLTNSQYLALSSSEHIAVLSRLLEQQAHTLQGNDNSDGDAAHSRVMELVSQGQTIAMDAIVEAGATTEERHAALQSWVSYMVDRIEVAGSDNVLMQRFPEHPFLTNGPTETTVRRFHVLMHVQGMTVEGALSLAIGSSIPVADFLQQLHANFFDATHFDKSQIYPVIPKHLGYYSFEHMLKGPDSRQRQVHAIALAHAVALSNLDAGIARRILFEYGHFSDSQVARLMGEHYRIPLQSTTDRETAREHLRMYGLTVTDARTLGVDLDRIDGLWQAIADACPDSSAEQCGNQLPTHYYHSSNEVIWEWLEDVFPEGIDEDMVVEAISVARQMSDAAYSLFPSSVDEYTSVTMEAMYFWENGQTSTNTNNHIDRSGLYVNFITVQANNMGNERTTVILAPIGNIAIGQVGVGQLVIMNAFGLVDFLVPDPPDLSEEQIGPQDIIQQAAPVPHRGPFNGPNGQRLAIDATIDEYNSDSEYDSDED